MNTPERALPRAISGRVGGINPGTPQKAHPRERFLAGGGINSETMHGNYSEVNGSFTRRNGSGLASSPFGELIKYIKECCFSSISKLSRNPGARRRQPRRLKTIQDPILDSLESEWDSGAARWNSPRISLAGWRGRHPGFRCIPATPRGCIFSPGRRFAPPRL